jgi:hypothetical protein
MLNLTGTIYHNTYHQCRLPESINPDSSQLELWHPKTTEPCITYLLSVISNYVDIKVNDMGLEFASENVMATLKFSLFLFGTLVSAATDFSVDF